MGERTGIREPCGPPWVGKPWRELFLDELPTFDDENEMDRQSDLLDERESRSSGDGLTAVLAIEADSFAVLSPTFEEASRCRSRVSKGVGTGDLPLFRSLQETRDSRRRSR